jgi:hypothetical protein
MTFKPLKNLLECRTAICALETGFRENFYEAVAGLYRSGQKLCEDDTKYETFCKWRFWSSCKQKVPSLNNDHKTRLLFVCRFAFKARDTTGKRYNRAYKIARALYDLFEADVDYSEVAAELDKRGGAHYFYSPERDRAQEASSMIARGPGSGGRAQPATTGRLPRRSEGRSDCHGDHAASNSASIDDEGDKNRNPSRSRRPRADREHLIVEIEEHDLTQVLQMELGQAAHLDIEVVGFEGEWRRIKGRFHA